MDKYDLGKVIGEMYRIQNQLGMPCAASNDHIYGLLNRFEDAIDEEFKDDIIKSCEVKAICEVLNPIWSDPVKLDAFKGFYDIENELKGKGIDRYKVRKIIKYIYAQGRFMELIEKMNTNNSPCECKDFKLDELDY